MSVGETHAPRALSAAEGASMPKSRYHPEKARKFCARIAAGETLDAACDDSRMPGKPEILDWLCEEPAFRARYARARELHADTLCDEMLHIIDRKGGEEAGAGEPAQTTKLRIDTLKWLVARWTPKALAADPGRDLQLGQRPVIQVITGVPDAEDEEVDVT
jgi:hypothetical protein